MEKLKIFDDEIRARQRVAENYTSTLEDVVTCPHVPESCQSVWAQYTIRLPKDINRDNMQKMLKDKGIPTAVYYAKPLHQQQAYKNNLVGGYKNGGELPVTNALSRDVLSLPIHPYLNTETQEYIIKNIRHIIETFR